MLRLRLVEFVCEKIKDEFSPCVVLIDCDDVTCIEQLPKTTDRCKLITKQKNEYILYGTYKTLTNRLYYALSKKHNIYEDDTIRPSIRVFHRPNLLEIDSSFFDETQLKAFIFALNPEFDFSFLPEHTLEISNKSLN